MRCERRLARTSFRTIDSCKETTDIVHPNIVGDRDLGSKTTIIRVLMGNTRGCVFDLAHHRIVSSAAMFVKQYLRSNKSWQRRNDMPRQPHTTPGRGAARRWIPLHPLLCLKHHASPNSSIVEHASLTGIVSAVYRQAPLDLLSGSY